MTDESASDIDQKYEEELIDSSLELQEDLEAIQVKNPIIQNIINRLVDALHTIKSLQNKSSLRMIQLEHKMRAELKSIHVRDLDLARWTSEYLNVGEERKYMDIREMIVIRQALVNILNNWEALEMGVEEKGIDVKKTIEQKALKQRVNIEEHEDIQRRKLAELIKAYLEIRKQKEENTEPKYNNRYRIRQNLLKKEINDIQLEREFIERNFKKFTKEELKVK